MSFHQVLEATLQYLEDLRARGVRYVPWRPNLPTPAREVVAEPGPVRRASPTAPAARVAAAPSRAGLEAASPGQAVPSGTAEDLLPRTASAPPLTGLQGEAKTQAMAELRERALACTKCAHLAKARKNVVFGVGSIDAELMFVGEAPGADEDVQGEPFVGRAGELLTKMIQAMGLQRSQVYIGNILKCRPDTPGQATGNRKPTPEEMATCISYLHGQIDLIQPKVLIALGATAVEGLLGKTIGITRLRGQWRTYRGIPLMPTYHPAYLLRNQSIAEKRRVWEDMLQVMEKLGLPISDKQRGFFLPKPTEGA